MLWNGPDLLQLLLIYGAQTTVETTSDFDHRRGISFSFMVKTNRNQTWACVPTPLFISPVSVPFLDHQTQEPRWLVNEISTSKWLFLCFPLLAVLFLMLVSSLCCSISAVKQTLRAQCRNAAMSWDELVLCLGAVYARGQHQGLLERISRRHKPMVILHSLTSSLRPHVMHDTF